MLFVHVIYKMQNMHRASKSVPRLSDAIDRARSLLMRSAEGNVACMRIARNLNDSFGRAELTRSFGDAPLPPVRRRQIYAGARGNVGA